MPQALAFDQYRLMQLKDAVAPVWLFIASLNAGAYLRPVVTYVTQGQFLLPAEIATLTAYWAMQSLPAVVVRTGHLNLLPLGCVVAHLAVSALIWSAGLGLTPFLPGQKTILTLHLETLLCAVFTYQYQLTLPVLTVLHALRQAGWMSIVLCQMGGERNGVLLRGVANWLVMMIVSCSLEMRMRAGFQKLRQQKQKKQQEKQQETQQAEQAAPDSESPWLDTASDAAGDLLCACKLQSSSCDGSQKQGTESEVSGLTIGHQQDELGGRPVIEDGASTPGLNTIGETTADVAAGGPVGAATDAVDAVVGTPAAHGVSVIGPLSNEALARRILAPAPPAALKGVSKLTAGKPGWPTPQQQDAARDLLRGIEQGRSMPYTRNRDGYSNTVYIKMADIELEQMPPELPKLIHEQLRHCMPGARMKGLALRSGCVMMTLDLGHRMEDHATLSADGMRMAITRLMQSHSMGHVLKDGATMCIQGFDELALSRWGGASGGYLPEDASPLAALSMAGLTSCRMAGAQPTVLCLPKAGDASRLAGAGASCDQQLSLTVELELPSNCQLRGWQPAGVAAPAGLAVPADSDGWLQVGPVSHAMLLARRLDGGYLPVLVERVSEGGRGVATHHTTAQVTVAVDGMAPAALRLELWYKTEPMSTERTETEAGAQGLPAATSAAHPGRELLVSRMPLLVLPGSWKEAAAELQHHIEVMGGVKPWHTVPLDAPSAQNAQSSKPASTSSNQPHADAPASCLLEDLGRWLAHHHRPPSSVVLDSLTPHMGDGILVYAVQHGLGAVAGVIVSVMQGMERQSTTSTVATPASGSVWLRRVANGGPGSSDSAVPPCGSPWATRLLHAAMASGSAEILGHVISWGVKYGGSGWAWSWELEDATGCTALHLAAAQPAAGACAALLKTIACMLPAAQVQAARSAWLHCQGGVGVPPAELFASVSSGGNPGSLWVPQESEPEHKAAAGPSTAGTSSRQEVAAAPVPSQPPARTSFWLRGLVEVWVNSETEEYRAWAKQQNAQSMRYWAAALLMMAPAAMLRSAMAGCLQYEFLHIALHTMFFVPAMVSASGSTWFGDSQAWMLMAHILPICSWVAKASLTNQQAVVWISSASTGADALYVVLVGAATNKIPLPQLLVLRVIEAYFHSVAYRTAGFAHPHLRAVAVHATALAISNLARVWSLRSFKRWQAEKQGRCIPAEGDKGQSSRRRDCSRAQKCSA